MNEIELSGGRKTEGVFRVGQTVCRPPNPNSDFVSRLLHHLEAVEFKGAPQALGVDDHSRDIFSYIEGDVPSDLGWYDDERLIEAADLIRHYQDATAPIVETATEFEVICHNDLSPCNFVFRDGKPVALIDFDSLAPGTRINDIAYAAWLWLDLGNSEIDAAEQIRRLQLFVDGYGGKRSLAAVTRSILARQRLLIEAGRKMGNANLVRWGAACFPWTTKHMTSN
jgi:tRNA A-37 threonylcarbamoyl transferase component Bud32